MFRILKGAVKLSRVLETLGISLSYTILGMLIAIKENVDMSPYLLVILLLSNVIAVISTFMINDVADADDDKVNCVKAKRNPVSAGIISKREGLTITWCTIIIALALYASLGIKTFLIGVSIILVGYFYSWGKIRLKTKPPLDVLSHIYFLGIALTLTTYTTFGISSKSGILLLAIIALTSVEVELKNGFRDYELDKETGVRTSVGVLGKKRTKHVRILNYLLMFIAVTYLGTSLFLA